MKLKVLGSSSQGNCYFIEAENEILILECGVPIKEIKKELDWSFRKVRGCLVTHSHNDHSRSIRDLNSFGVKVFAPRETFEAKKINSPFAFDVQENSPFRLGKFKVMPLPAKHDVPIVSYLISHPEMGSLLFATDTYILPYEIKGINHWMIEANYDREKLAEDVLEGRTNAYLAQRVVKSHMSIEKTLEAVKAAGLGMVENIVLIHLSDSNSDLDSFRRRMQEASGRPVWIADKGLAVTLNLSDEERNLMEEI